MIFYAIFAAISSLIGFLNQNLYTSKKSENPEVIQEISSAKEDLANIEVKGRTPKSGYSRKQFGDGWQKGADNCDTRNKILKRDLTQTTENTRCQILTGILNDPYTGQQIKFERSKNSAAVQIDHVVALSDAWQKGAQALDFETRVKFANDPLNLLASEGDANQKKGDSDAATWLPPNKNFRCAYIKRQISIKKKYSLWVTPAEKSAMLGVLEAC